MEPVSIFAGFVYIVSVLERADINHDNLIQKHEIVQVVKKDVDKVQTVLSKFKPSTKFVYNQ